MHGKRQYSRIFAALLVAILLGCGAESDRRIAGISASHTTSYSAWSVPVAIGDINTTPFNDQQPTLSKDGLTMFFASNRPGTPGPGPNDIWVTHRECLDCAWSAAVNIGAPINTGANEAAPAL